MSETKRVPITVRLHPEDKEVFVRAAEQCGLESGIAARQVLEMVVKRLREGGDFLDALVDLRVAFRERSRAA